MRVLNLLEIDKFKAIETSQKETHTYNLGDETLYVRSITELFLVIWVLQEPENRKIMGCLFFEVD